MFVTALREGPLTEENQRFLFSSIHRRAAECGAVRGGRESGT